MAAVIDFSLGEHTAGQVTDQFDASASHADVNLFRFHFTNNSAVDVTVDEIVFPLSAVNGISDATSDLANLDIYVDSDGNGPRIPLPQAEQSLP